MCSSTCYAPILEVALIKFSTVSLPYPPNIPRFILLPLASQNKITRGDGKTLRALHPLSTPNLAKPSLQYYTSICRSTGSNVEYKEFRDRSRMGATLAHATTISDFWVSCLWGRITGQRGRRWASIVLLLPFPPQLLLLLPFILNTMTSNNNNNPIFTLVTQWPWWSTLRLPPPTISTLTVEVELRDVSSFSPPVLPPHHYLHPTHHPPSLTRY